MKARVQVALLSLAFLTFAGATSWSQANYFGTRSSSSSNPSITLSPSPASAAKAPISLSAQDIKIITSVWGSEHKFVEVTDRLADVLNHPDTEYEIGVDWLHADPAPGWKKVMVTVFEVRGTRYTMGNHEGIKISVHKFQEFLQNLEASKAH